MAAGEPSCLEYFSGGVPTGEYFRLTLESLSETFIRETQGINRLNELCFIGLVSYFEAFCKDHFASILSIEPRLLTVLRDRGQNTLLDPATLLDFRDEWPIRLGFLVAEKLDFGSARKINALYNALLNITPFSKDELKYYESILRDRNLLVHHGGMITHAYSKQGTTGNSKHRPYFDSLVVDVHYFDERLGYVAHIATKMLKSSHNKLNSLIQQWGCNYSAEKLKAVDALLWWGDDKENISSVISPRRY